MDQQIIHELKYQQFTLAVAGDEAELAYSRPSDDIISFTHTFVPEAARGNGVADKLIEAGLQFAEENKLRVVASCPVVTAYLKRHPEYRHLEQ